MKTKAIIFSDSNKNNGNWCINWGGVSNVVEGYCNYYSEDPYLIMSEETLDMLASPFVIIRDDIKDVLVAKNVLNGKDWLGNIYTGGYKVFIDNDLPVGTIDVR